MVIQYGVPKVEEVLKLGPVVACFIYVSYILFYVIELIIKIYK